ncbi:MAG: CHAT domain-containing protein [Bacteroidales bacterium]|nr:CHAT domain-containing protein [Bacteroidales bacterium]
MKLIFTIFCLMLPVLVFGQSEESTNYYNKAREYYMAKQYEEALRCLKISDSLDKAQLKETDPNYNRASLEIPGCLSQLSVQRSKEGKYDDAILYGTEAAEAYKKKYGAEHKEYATSLSNLAFFYDKKGNYPEAIRLVTLASEIYKKALGEKAPDYISSRSSLAQYNARNGNYAEALRIGNATMAICKEFLGENSPYYALAVNDVASYHNYLGNYAEAIRLGTIASNLYKKLLGDKHPNYAITLNNLASNNANASNYTEAIRLQARALRIYKEFYGENNPNYAQALNNMADYYSNIGNNDEAIRLVNTALDIFKKTLGEKHPYYAIAINNLAQYNAQLSNYKESARLEKIALDIYRETVGEQHRLYAQGLNNLASSYACSGKYKDAIRLGDSAVALYKKLLGEDHPAYATALNNLSEYNFYMGNYYKAIRLATLTAKKFENILGNTHPRYGEVQRELAKYYMCAGEYGNALDSYTQGYNILSSYIMKNFASMTYKERTNFWNNYSKFFDDQLPIFAYKTSENEPSYSADATMLAYNSELFAKGLLLNAELEMQKIIEGSGDSTFAARYYKIRNDRKLLDDLYQMPVSARKINTDSLKRAIEREERWLVNSSKQLGDYTKNLQITWSDVQQKLGKKDVAIEFAAFKDSTIKQDVYIALVLKKGMKAPVLVKLFESDTFWKIRSDEYYNTPNLYNIVWKPLEPYLKKAKNIYFSPASRFHTIGIEYLPDDNGQIVADKYDTYRLSSTRELALMDNKEAIFVSKVATFGGIQYNYTKEDWEKLKNQEDADSTIKFHDAPEINDNMRGGIVFLQGTKEESSAIADLLRNADFDVTAVSDKAATEESFKQLSGTGLNILHIGTHGFYKSETDMENAKLGFYTSSSELSSEDRALSCSGLLFAGASAAVDPRLAKEIPEGVDDGVLTAKEISRLDFKELDLAVLSACQTGLGNVTGDGVFGLQRGLQKAGAHPLVMSLWKVYDDATQLWMVEFFKNLTNGMPKRDAFIAAQKVVRQQFPDPNCWAAFVMIDGI